MSNYAKGDPNDPFRDDKEGSSAFAAVLMIVGEAPGRSVLIVTLLLLASVSEGLGILSVLPLLAPFLSGGESSTVPAFDMFQGAFASLGIEPSTAVVLVIIVVFISLKAIFVMLAMSLVGYARAQYVTELRMSLLKRLMQAKWSFFLNQPIGVFANALGVEATMSGTVYAEAFRFIAITLQVLVYVVVSFAISWQAAIAAVFGGILIGVLLGWLVNTTKNVGRKQRLAYEMLSSRLSDLIQGIKPLKAMAIEGRVLPLLHSEVSSLRRTMQIMVLSQEGLKFGQEVIATILLTIGFIVALRAGLEFGSLIVMALLFLRASGRIGEVQRSYQKLVRSEPFRQAVSRKIAAAKDAAESSFGAGIPRFDIAIEVNNVHFGYGNGVVLEDVSLKIEKGQLTTIRGPSGSGKTTLVDLVIGLYRPDRGTIRIDGQDMSSLDIMAWRSSLGYLPQDPFLFHNSIFRNVALDDERIGREQVIEALQLAGAWGFVEQLPEGLQTVPGERGGKLSGGQRQRVALARALARQPSLLILDEPTTALDPRTEDEICATLNALKGKVTMLAISHQPALGQIASVVYELKEGKAVLTHP